MATAVKKLVKGKYPTLLDTEKANDVIDAINAMLLAKVSPDGFGKFEVGKEHAVLDLGALAVQLSQIKDAINSIAAALNNPDFNIVCNGDGSITATLNFPQVNV